MEIVTILERNDATMIGWMENVRREYMTPAEELKNSATLKRKCLQSRKMQCFGHLKRMEEHTWLIKCTMCKEDNLGKG